MSIVRAPRPQRNYITITNEVAHDENLSYTARGLLVAILSNYDGWRTNIRELSEHSGKKTTTQNGQPVTGRKNGRESVAAAMRELRDAGYAEVKRTQNALGQWSTETIVYDDPYNH